MRAPKNNHGPKLCTEGARENFWSFLVIIIEKYGAGVCGADKRAGEKFLKISHFHKSAEYGSTSKIVKSCGNPAELWSIF